MKVIYNPCESLCPTDDIEDGDHSAHICETPATVCDVEGGVKCDGEEENGVAVNKLRKDRYKERGRKTRRAGGGGTQGRTEGVEGVGRKAGQLRSRRKDSNLWMIK